MSLSDLCAYWQYSRQAYYQAQHRQQIQSLQEDLILELVREQKRDLPNSGGKKMLHLIQSELDRMQICIGRDRFFDLLRANDLLVKRKKKVVFTTNSNHPFKVYGNLIKNLEVQTILQVIVADITYIRTLEGFLYLSLLTDAYSRKIIGWHLGDSLELEGCVQALQQFLKTIRPNLALKQPMIHHSDRGSQYCSYAYTDLLKKFNIKVSMAAAGNCYENAQAERVNGILKSEFELDQTFATKNISHKAVKSAIRLYNHKRPHWSCQLKTPALVFDPLFKELFVSTPKPN